MTTAFALETISFAMLGIIAAGVLLSMRPFRRKAQLNIHEKLDQLIHAKKVRGKFRQQMLNETVETKPQRRKAAV